MRCEQCPREDETVRDRLRQRPNYGTGTPWVIEPVRLCDSCALVAEDVHDTLGLAA